MRTNYRRRLAAVVAAVALSLGAAAIATPAQAAAAGHNGVSVHRVNGI